MLPNPWLILGVVLAWIASLGAVGYWQNGAGKTSERVTWQARENAQLAAANKEIERLRGIERDGALRIAAIGDDHAKRVADLEAQHLRDVDAVRAGALKLRIPASACPARGAGEVSTAPQVGNDSASGELPPEITRRLFELADDADINTLDLAACQAAVNVYLSQEKP